MRAPDVKPDEASGSEGHTFNDEQKQIKTKDTIGRKGYLYGSSLRPWPLLPALLARLHLALSRLACFSRCVASTFYLYELLTAATICRTFIFRSCQNSSFTDRSLVLGILGRSKGESGNLVGTAFFAADSRCEELNSTFSLHSAEFQVFDKRSFSKSISQTWSVV